MGVVWLPAVLTVRVLIDAFALQPSPWCSLTCW